ncbi:MAG: hypothetical protein JWM46_843 [Candidatus Kaiserbacteria bacterium]|nr:hypothetical protein [Candidatus Kaiserbacteria bacterium]
MTVGDVYEKYRLLPILKMHQLRVAAVGKTICDHFDRGLDTQSVVLACLLHDMGNIIKSDLSVFPAALEPQGRDHWEQVKKEFIATYGPDEHQAALTIAREIGASEAVIRLMDGIGFSKLEITRDHPLFEPKIVEYSDCRVSPAGITDMTVRLEDARARYAYQPTDIPRTPERFNELLGAAHEIEMQIFAHTDITPTELSEEALAPSIAALREYKIA